MDAAVETETTTIKCRVEKRRETTSPTRYTVKRRAEQHYEDAANH